MTGDRCLAQEQGTGARCDRPRGHEGHHESEQGRSWPTRRERTGEVEPRDTSLDVARLEHRDGRWWILASHKRVAEGGITEGTPMVMYAFHERSTAEAVCVTLNAMVLGDAFGAVADEEVVPS